MKPPTIGPDDAQDDRHDQPLAAAGDQVGDEAGDGSEDDPGDDAHGCRPLLRLLGPRMTVPHGHRQAHAGVYPGRCGLVATGDWRFGGVRGLETAYNTETHRASDRDDDRLRAGARQPVGFL